MSRPISSQGVSEEGKGVRPPNGQRFKDWEHGDKTESNSNGKYYPEIKFHF